MEANTIEWRVITMDELWSYNNKDRQDNVVIRPKFPTRRWGNAYTKTSTTDIRSINDLLDKLKEHGHVVRKRIEKKTKQGPFYRLEIKNHSEKII